MVNDVRKQELSAWGVNRHGDDCTGVISAAQWRYLGKILCSHELNVACKPTGSWDAKPTSDTRSPCRRFMKRNSRRMPHLLSTHNSYFKLFVASKFELFFLDKIKFTANVILPGMVNSLLLSDPKICQAAWLPQGQSY